MAKGIITMKFIMTYNDRSQDIADHLNHQVALDNPNVKEARTLTALETELYYLGYDILNMNKEQMKAVSDSRYRIYFINHSYWAGESFATLDQAIAHTKKVGFESAIYQHNKVVATWSIITGLHRR